MFQPFEAPSDYVSKNCARFKEGRHPSPIALVLFQRRHTQKLIYSLLGIILFDLFCIVVFVLDANIAGFIVVRSLVLEVISTSSLAIGNTGVNDKELTPRRPSLA